jgi:predicted AAA+ superfamily ATPase
MVGMERLVGKYIFDPEISAGKMVFLCGPRQVGKTTFALNWLASMGVEGTYFNWDDPAVKKEYNRNPLCFKNIVLAKFHGKPVPVVFDEIHKHKNWKNILKGFYDTTRDKMHLLVTGSARLGVYRKSGDSLVGRYFSFQMLPLSLPEATGDFSWVLNEDGLLSEGESLIRFVERAQNKKTEDGLNQLMTFGGFPEPYLKGSQRFLRRWHEAYKTLLTKEDVRDLSRIADLKGLEQLIEILPSKVGSPLSINSIREDLGYHHGTITTWIEILSRLYLIFTIRPWHRNIVRSIKKERKLFFFDWSLLEDSGSRFENLVAVALLRMAARFTEMGLGAFELMYVRDKEKREVDFIVIKDNRPLALFEAKEGDDAISPSGKYFANKLGIPFYQISPRHTRVEAFPGDCFKIPAPNFLLSVG